MSLRNFIRNFIRFIGYFFSPKLHISSHINAKVLGGDSHFFVGYHDHDPISADGNNILCHRVQSSFTQYVEPKSGEVGLLNIATGLFQPVSTVHALNWQLGSRVQWFNENCIIFNDIEDGLHCSKIFDTKTGLLKDKLPWAFWSISPNKVLGVSLNFSVLSTHRPGYGYPGISPDMDLNIIRIFNLSSHDVVFEFDLKFIADVLNINYFDHDDVYLNHVSWNKDSTKFITLLCWESSLLGRRVNYGVLFDIHSNSFELLNPSGFFSHLAWLDDERIIAYVEVDGIRGYFIWSAENGWSDVLSTFPREDGHPTPDSFGGSVFVDTYPSMFSNMQLFRCSIQDGVRYERLLNVSSNPIFVGPLRCDLHPRFSESHRQIVCDLPCFNTRKILVLDL